MKAPCTRLRTPTAADRALYDALFACAAGYTPAQVAAGMADAEDHMQVIAAVTAAQRGEA